jgi:hypothetical protein
MKKENSIFEIRGVKPHSHPHTIPYSQRAKFEKAVTVTLAIRPSLQARNYTHIQISRIIFSKHSSFLLPL